jgi:DNA-binding transcriptional LysR family regulator
VELTEKGRQFQNSVAVALMHLTNAAAEIRTDDAAEHLEIATDTSMAAMWLMPRLAQFESQFPDVSLRLIATDVQSELLGSRFQIALAHGEGDWRGQVATKLFDEEVFPVCAPSYLEQRGGELTATDLPHCSLLDLEFEQWNWMNWAIWLTEMDLPLPTTARRMSCNNYPLVIDAARRGAGVALGWRRLVDEDLASGALLAPIEAHVNTRFAYYLLRPFNDALTPVAARFRDWILAECES